MVCGYIHEGETAPQECPICHVGAEKFEELVETEGALAWADEHKIGVAKDVDPEILQGLRNEPRKMMVNIICCGKKMQIVPT